MHIKFHDPQQSVVLPTCGAAVSAQGIPDVPGFIENHNTGLRSPERLRPSLEKPTFESLHITNGLLHRYGSYCIIPVVEKS